MGIVIKRPMVTLWVVAAGGILLWDSQPSVIITVLVAYFLLIILILALCEHKKHLMRKYVLPGWYGHLLIFLILLPFFFALFYIRTGAVARHNQRLKMPYSIMYRNCEENCVLWGKVKRVQSDGDKVILTVSDCTVKGFLENVSRKAGNVLITLSREKAEKNEIICGNSVKVFGKLVYFLEAENPGQFNRAFYYERKGIFAIVHATVIETEDLSTDHVRELLSVSREAFKNSLFSVFDGSDAGIMTAILLGDKGELESDTKDLFRKAGISHLLAISGLHISIICLGLHRLLLKMTIEAKIRRALTVIFIFMFVIFVGFPTSAVRAALMSVVLILSYADRRHYDLLSALSLAGIVILFMDPFELYDSSFLLSFASIVGVYAGRELRAGWTMTVIISLVTLPLSLLCFYEFSPYAVLANLLVLPVTEGLLVLGLAAGGLGMISAVAGKFAGGGAFFLLRWLENVAGIIQKMPFSYVLTGKPSLMSVIIYYLLLALFFCVVQKNSENLFRNKLVKKGKENKKGTLKFCFSLALMLVGLIGLLTSGSKSRKELTFLKVGQGDCAFYENEEGETILFDCGSSSESKVGTFILVPFLKNHGIMLLDTVTVSHLDEDHMNGVKELLDSMGKYKGDGNYRMHYDGNPGLKRLVLPKVTEKSESYRELENMARRKGVEVIYAEKGDVISNFKIVCIWPEKAEKSDNGTSLVFILDTGRENVVFSGDIGEKEEKEIVQNLVEGRFKIEGEKKVILKIGHHGSRYSSSEEWLLFWRPELAVISCGHGNSYGHPHEDTLGRIKKVGAGVYRMDENPSLILEY